MSSKAQDQKVRWEEMFPEEMLDAIEQRPVCYCPYGFAEPHGAYNALGVDWIKMQAICERAAREHGGLVMPPFAWHVSEQAAWNWPRWRGVKQPLASSIPLDLFLHTMMHHLRVVDARGFHVAMVVTGHGGGVEHDIRLLCEYYLRRSGSPLRIFAAGEWEFIHYKGYRSGHAGVVETSQFAALRPELVDLSRKEAKAPRGPWCGTLSEDSNAEQPSAELGEHILRSQVRYLGKIQRKLLAQYRPKKNWSVPTQTDVEAMWTRFEQMTRKYWRWSWTQSEYEQKLMMEFPGWAALGE